LARERSPPNSMPSPLRWRGLGRRSPIRVFAERSVQSLQPQKYVRPNGRAAPVSTYRHDHLHRNLSQHL
jgi:hypothetical protein